MNKTEEQFLQKLTEIIDANLHNEQFGVTELAEQLGMSRATLHRRVKALIKKSVSEFIRETRLKHARELLLQKAGTISEIAYNVGFGSVTYFTKCFHDYYGYPPGEVEKTIDIENNFRENIPAKNQSKPGHKKILVGSLILVVFLTALVLFHLKPFRTRTLPKTIAVLPFINDSKDTTTTLILNGILEGIIDNLCEIHDLDIVVSRTSVEQYRNNKTKSIRQIAKELNVAYIVEGSGQINNDQISIRVQLIEGDTDNHLMSEVYDRNYDDILALQSEIAFLVADKIDAVITPEEKERIEKKPTNSIPAYNLLQQAINVLYDDDDQEYNQMVKQKAEKKIRKVISLDSTYSEAYVHLGWNLAGQRKITDTILHLANRALKFDNKNANAYYLKGWYLLWFSQKPDEAEKAFRQSVQLNTNNSPCYSFLGDIMYVKGDFARMIEYKLRTIELVRGSSRADYLYYISFQLYSLGFFKEGLKFSEEIIKEYGDSSFYYLGLEGENINSGDYKAAYDFCLKSGRPDNVDDWWVRANVFCYLRDFKETLKIVDTLEINGGENVKFFKKDGQIIPNPYIGFTYLKNGLKDKAAFHFNGVIREQQKIINESTGRARGFAYYVLVRTYSAMGEKAKAEESMKKMLKHKNEILLKPIEILELRKHPMSDAIQGTAEHEEILRIAEENFQPVKKKIEEHLRKAGY